MFSLRLFKPEDLIEVAAISAAGQYSDWSLRQFEDCFKENYQAWVLRNEEKILGFVVLLFQAEEAELLNLGVLPEWQHQGLASRLLQQVIEFARTKGLREIFLEVHELNDAAIHLYEKFQFKRIGRRKNYYIKAGVYHDAVLFSLDVTKC